MKRKLLFLYLVLCPFVLGMAVTKNKPGFGDRRYSLSVMAEYAYNTTWSHHGNVAVHALLPFNPHFEMEAGCHLSSANVYTCSLNLRPKFEMPVGEVFVETDLMYRAVARNKIGDITAAVGVGYRMDYVSVTLGLFGRVLDSWTRSWYSNETYTVEPFNLLYRIEVFCRPQTSPWNLSFCISNMDDKQMERMWQPLFMAGAYYDVNKHWRVNFAAQCKPTGMYHLDATFYGASFRTGFTYKF